MTKESTALAVVEQAQFPIIGSDPQEIANLISENFGDETFSPFDLDKIVVPGGGATTWEIPTIEGIKEAKEFRGVIVIAQRARGYWQSEGMADGTPPDCSSEDGVVGIGEPGGMCAKCPLAQANSSSKEDSKGAACKERRNLFVLLEGSMFPVMVQVPRTSIKNFNKYKAGVTGQMKSIHQVVTIFSLEKTKTGGYTHSVVNFKMGGELPQEGYNVVKSYKKSFLDILSGGSGNGHTEDGPTFDQ